MLAVLRLHTYIIVHLRGKIGGWQLIMNRMCCFSWSLEQLLNNVLHGGGFAQVAYISLHALTLCKHIDQSHGPMSYSFCWHERCPFTPPPPNVQTISVKKKNFATWWIACENIHFSSLFADGDVSRGATSATQRQKFHTDDAIQCLHNKSSSHGVPNTNLSNFTCLLVDFGKVLCLSANEL